MGTKWPHRKQLQLRICIDQAGDTGLTGSAWTVCLKEPLPYTDVHSFLLDIDRIFDTHGYPQAFQRKRTFTRHKTVLSPCSCESAGLKAEDVQAARGALSTWDLWVISRRNASWQGWLTGLDGNKRHFSSELELIRILCGRTAD